MIDQCIEFAYKWLSISQMHATNSTWFPTYFHFQAMDSPFAKINNAELWDWTWNFVVMVLLFKLGCDIRNDVIDIWHSTD